ncbi:reverse transcriptase domain-containing protein [Tanacetum coccineum]|uniref:Reverse transcriptase domain-containing protein n=1 Tax=Tanacetum coccineum TaxID=301880 RepID=A0ABQ4ZKY6_9ASTR
MHRRASNFELVEPLAEPERTLNRRLCRLKRRVPFERLDKRPEHPRVVYVPILGITYFWHFINLSESHNPMANPDDEPMWAADRVVVLTPGSTIAIPKTANKFTIKGNHLTLVQEIWCLGSRNGGGSVAIHGDYTGGDMVVERWYKEAFGSLDPRALTPSSKVSNGMPNYGKFLKELVSNKHKLEQISSAFISNESSSMIQNKVPPKLGDPGTGNMLVEVGKFTFPMDFVILTIEKDSKVPLILGRPFLHIADAVIHMKQKQLNLRVGSKRMTFSIDSSIKHSYSNADTCFSIDEILEEDFDALLDE